MLLLSDKLPEVAVTKPHDQTPPTRRAVVNKQNDNNPFATFLTLLICVGIITGMSIFTYKVYRQKWFQKRTSNEYRVEMHRADPSATWMGRVSLVFFKRRFCLCTLMLIYDSRKFHGLVLGLVELIDAKGIDLAQPIWP